MKLIPDNTLVQLLLAVAAGLALGFLGLEWIDVTTAFVATVFTRLFQLLAVPTVALAIITTLSTIGRSSNSGLIFRRALTYTLLTTFAAAGVGLTLFLSLSQANTSLTPTSLTPDPSPKERGVYTYSNEDTTSSDFAISNGNHAPLLLEGSSVPAGRAGRGVGGEAREADGGEASSYADHLLDVVPNNIVRPFLDGNVLSVLLLAVAVGLALARGEQEGRLHTVRQFVVELQELLFMLIRALVRVLPIGIIAFSAQLAVQITGGMVAGALGRYLLIILGGNAIQFFVVLPLFLVARGLNPLRVFRAMTPAVLMALFTKSSAATLPVTMQSAEERLGARAEVARFVLPICTTINMNGCAAFILVTSLFVMQCGGLLPDASTPLLSAIGFYALWTLIAVFAAVGNAGVPMGCYFLTLSLVSGIDGAPLQVLGLILPLYTVIDMIETAENVWSDSCVCAMTDHDLSA